MQLIWKRKLGGEKDQVKVCFYLIVVFVKNYVGLFGIRNVLEINKIFNYIE